jgi:hypothetical protein
LTGLQTLQGIQWESVRLFFSLDKAWVQHEEALINELKEIFPTSQIFNYRLSKSKEWLEASNGMSNSSIVYLHANDDHALVSGPESFEQEAQRLFSDEHARLTMITHYPEVKAILYRQKPFGWLRNKDYINVNYALGTTLVKTDFFRRWWSSESFSDQEIVYRPDNPVGRSVIFSKTRSLVPRTEIIRHMDGYAHVNAQRPLGPLRNLTNLCPSPSTEASHCPQFVSVLWPSRILGTDGKGGDLHLVDGGERFWNQVFAGVARLNAQWAIRISFLDFWNARNSPSKLPLHSFLVSATLATLVPRNLRNMADTVFDPILLGVLVFSKRIFMTKGALADKVYYLGSWRAISLSLKNKFDKQV